MYMVLVVVIDGFLGVYLFPNSRNYIHYICMTFYMSIIPQLSGKKKSSEDKMKKGFK